MSRESHRRVAVRRALPALSLAVLLVLAGCLSTVDPDDVLSGRDKVVAPCLLQFPVPSLGPEGRANPAGEADPLGWEAGVWHDDEIALDTTDGLTCTELERLVARTMARVELVRELEFTETPRVEVVSREAFVADLPSGSPHRDYVALQNVKYEALFLVDEATDATQVQRENRGTSVAAYYSAATETVVMVVPEVPHPVFSEGVLAHEFVHALQDQRFDALDYDPRGEDAGNAYRGLVEGDANYVEYLYERRCAAEWGDCLLPDREERSSGNRTLANRGVFTITYQPYSDGPVFVREAREAGDWAAVNDLYRAPPESTEQIIHPEKYPEDRPIPVRVDDESTDAWSPIRLLGEPNTETLGELGLFAMFLWPAYETDGEVEFVPLEAYRNLTESGDLTEWDPFDHTSPYSDGWGGDRLVAYRNGDGETGYVWALAFDTDEDAAAFVDGYERLLVHHGATEGDRPGTWVVPEDRPFADAFAVERDGSRVTVVNAPDVAALGEIRPGVGG